MSELQADNTDAILGGQNSPSVNAAVLGGVAGEKWKLAHDLASELGFSHKLAYNLSQTHEIFSFKTVMVNKRGEIATRTRKKAYHYI
jgi:hypothetical protein